MNRSQVPNVKEQLIATEQALDELWVQVGTHGQSAAERERIFAEIARLEELAEDLRHRLPLSLIRDT